MKKLKLLDTTYRIDKEGNDIILQEEKFGGVLLEIIARFKSEEQLTNFLKEMEKKEIGVFEEV